MSQGFPIGDEELKKGEWLFRQECRFVAGVQKLTAMPETGLPEIAFAGRSNVGKSSLINALTSRKNLARASNTPGRTQQINFFELGGVLCLVDLPGYGYARASKEKVASWNSLIDIYLKGRGNLKRIYVLMDARHGIMAADQVALEKLDASGVPYVVVFTKADKAKPAELERIIARVETELKAEHPGAFPKVYTTSSFRNKGLAELRAILSLPG